MGKKGKKVDLSFTIEIDKVKEIKRLTRKLQPVPQGRFHSPVRGKKVYNRKEGKAVTQD